MAQATGVKGGKYMRKKIKYSNEPLDNLQIIDDFLPSPEELTFKEDNVKSHHCFKQVQCGFFQKRGKKTPNAISEDDPTTSRFLCSAPFKTPGL